jgi:hypothetical protein
MEIRFAVRENRLLDPSRVTDADYHWFSENPGIWVWEEDGRILGFSAADTRDGTIWALFIDPGTRADRFYRKAGWTALSIDERRADFPLSPLRRAPASGSPGPARRLKGRRLRCVP